MSHLSTGCDAELLRFAVGTPAGPHGVRLAYATPTGVFVLDPAADDGQPHRLEGVGLSDATAVAAALRADLLIAKARWVPAELNSPAPPVSGGASLRHSHADKAG